MVAIELGTSLDWDASVFLIGQKTGRVYLLEIEDRMMQRAASDSPADIAATLSSIIAVALERAFDCRVGEPIVLWIAVPLSTL